MSKLRVTSVLLAVLLLPIAALAQDVRHEIRFPDLPGYVTLKCDLHQHTVFSDGSVWPPVRVNEAWRQGLDAIALTDHIEYQPHKDDVPTNFHRPDELAAGPAAERGLLFPKGAEITRDTPPGHFNAIFLNDVNPLAIEDFVEQIKRANEQGAFVFWNHQGWKGPEKGRWLDVHTTLFENKWFHGMEVCNGDEYYPDAHQWCLDKNLTMLGTSDIHEPDLRTRSTPDNHRTMTLVFAKEKTLAGLKEALIERRTVVWYKDQLIGRREWLDPLFRACVQVVEVRPRPKDALVVEIRNRGHIDLQLERTGNLGPAKCVLPAETVSLVKLSGVKPGQPVELAYTATNLLVAPKTGLPVTLRIVQLEGGSGR